MARSGRSALAVVALATATAGAGLALAGCDTTQNAAARVKVRSERTLASREPVRIRGRAENVEAEATLVPGDKGTAIAVELTNTGTEPINDLPIAVGVRADGKEELLNGGKELPYFQTHTPAVGAGDTATWIYVDKEKVGGEAFAQVGKAFEPPVATAASLPSIDVGEPSVAGDDSATVEVANDVGFTQFDLAVFVWATKGDRIVAGGFAEAGDLEDGEAEDLTVTLIGDPKGAELHASAPPTIFK